MDTASLIGSLGILGALIGGYAYVPQIHHMVSQKCSAGISPRAFKLWTLSSLLILLNALYLQAVVFIVLSIIQLSASFTILALSTKNKGQTCQAHLHGDNPLA